MSGDKFDAMKDRWDLISWPAIQVLVDALTYGADLKPRPDGGRGYGDRNWEKGISFMKCFGANMRHLLKAIHGDDPDPESTLHHMGSAGACWMFLTHYLLHKEQYADFDDRPLGHAFRMTDRDWTDLLEEEEERQTEVDELREEIEKLNSVITKLVYSAPEVREGFRQMLADMDHAMKAGRMTESAPKILGLVQQLTTNQPAAVTDKEGRVLRGEDPTPEPDGALIMEDHEPFVRAAVVDNPTEEGLKEQIKLLEERNADMANQIQELMARLWEEPDSRDVYLKAASNAAGLEFGRLNEVITYQESLSTAALKEFTEKTKAAEKAIYELRWAEAKAEHEFLHGNGEPSPERGTIKATEDADGLDAS